MPTERFYHLAEEKKKQIREAAVKEFSRVSFDKVSINKIVQNAGISRGSFYTYFFDKEDVLSYIFEDLILQIQEFCMDILLKEKGDLWNLLMKMFDFVMEVCEKRNIFHVAQNTVGHSAVMKVLEKNIPCCSSRQGMPKDDWVEEIYQAADCSEMRVENVEDFKILFTVCITNIVATIGEIQQGCIEKSEGRQLLARRLNYIQYGAVKR